MIFTLTNDLKALIHQTHTQSSKRIFSIFWQGQKLWVKWAIPSKGKIYHLLQYGMQWMHPLLRPTVCKGGSAALLQEMQRLTYLKNHHICVPTVLDHTPHYLILSDLGPSFTDLLKEAMDPLALLSKAALGIAALHQKGHYCSTGLLRDLTLFRTNIGFLDAEEDLGTVMNISAAQTRNVLMFWLSAVRYCRSAAQLEELIRLSLTQEPAVVLHHLQALTPLFRLLKGCSPFISWIGGRDLREAASLARALMMCL